MWQSYAKAIGDNVTHGSGIRGSICCYLTFSRSIQSVSSRSLLFRCFYQGYGVLVIINSLLVTMYVPNDVQRRA